MIYENVKRLCQERGINIATLEKECGLGNAIVNKWGKRGSTPVSCSKKNTPSIRMGCSF